MNSFLTIGDKNYFPSIALSAIQANKFHPDFIFGIYDWGFTKNQKRYLEKLPNVHLIDWKDQFVEKPFYDNCYRSVWRQVRASSNLNLKLKIFLKSLFEILRYGLKGKEWIYAQKPYCYLDWASRKEIDKFIFLDGDAFITSPIEELFEGDFEFGVTLRRKEEISFERGRCEVLNSGVVVFSADSSKNKQIISAWIKNMSNTSDERFMDQTSLTRLVLGYEEVSDLKPGMNLNLEINKCNVEVKILDCEEYNYNWIEEGVGPKNKILHFKGGRHSGERFQDLAKSIGLSSQVNKVINIV